MSKLKLAPFAFLVLAATQGSALAQVSVGGQADVVVPMGDWSDITGLGFGVQGRLDYDVAPRVALTAAPGYIFHLSKEIDGVDLSSTELLLVGGARFFVAPLVDLHALTGLNVVTSKVSFMGQSESDSETRIPLILGGGVNLPSGLTLGADLFIPNLLLTDEGEEVYFGIMANVGFTIGI